MPIPHRRIRGKLHYTSDKPGRKGVERGREYFTITVNGDGRRTLRAYTEIDDAPNVMRDVTLSLRPDWKPSDAFVRISVTDWIEGGVTIADSIVYARELKAVGYDVVHCSSSGFDGAKIPVGPLYQVPLAEAVRKGANMPTAAVGLITTAQEAEQILEKGEADLIALARQALDDPNWPLHAMRELIAGDSYGNWPLQAGYAVRNKDRALGVAK